MSLSGRYSPYSKYIMQRELSAPALNRLESFESDDGEFYYVVDDPGDEESGRKTSIGFVHKKQMSASMSNLSTRIRPMSELYKSDLRYMSTPNFIKINKRAVIQSSPMEKINPRLVLHRSLKGVLKVYNNTNIRTKRSFSVENMDIFLPNGKIDPNLLAPMPINTEEKRSERLKKQQVKDNKKRLLVLKRRKLSPIAGTPHKDSKDSKENEKTPKRKPNTPKTRLEERLKKDKFGRLLTPKKEALPSFRATKKSTAAAKKKADAKAAEKAEDEQKDDKDSKKAINFLQQIQARNVLGRSIKARLAAKHPPPLTRQPSKQSIDSLFQEKPGVLKKKSSFGSLKSLSQSIKTIASFKSNKSEPSQDDEDAEAGDEITKLQNVKKDAKSKAKGSLLSKSKMLGRMSSASSTRSQKDMTVPPPSRSASKTSILSQSSAKDDKNAKANETPSRKSEVLRAPSTSSIMSMTTAAITANPLNTTLTITNQLATQGAEIRASEKSSDDKETSLAAAAVASHPDADKASMASQKTNSSQKTNNSKTGSRKTSAAKGSARNSARSSTEGKPRSRAGSVIGAIIGANSAIRYLRRKKSSESIDSEKDDGTQLTTGPGHGIDNEDFTGPIAGKILEQSQRSLERVQKTVDKATSEIHQTINANLTDLKTLEKKLSSRTLLDQDANNNDVAKGLSRHSTKLDMTASSSKLSASNGKAADQMSVNAISMAPDAQSALHHQTSQDSKPMDSSTR